MDGASGASHSAAHGQGEKSSGRYVQEATAGAEMIQQNQCQTWQGHGALSMEGAEAQRDHLAAHRTYKIATVWIMAKLKSPTGRNWKKPKWTCAPC